MMTAMAVARDQERGAESTDITRKNVAKVTRYRGTEEFDQLVKKIRARWGPALTEVSEEDAAHIAAKK
jgi:hypothetical protein